MAIDFMTLAQQNRLTYTDDKTRVYVKPLDRHNFITYPLEDLSGTVLVTLEEYLGLRVHYYQFNENLNGLELYVAPQELTEDEVQDVL